MAKFSVKKPLTVFVVVLAIVVLGVVAYLRMTPDLLPNMDFPYVVIVTTDPGASPEAVEEEVTRPMEQSMATLDRIKTVTSTSQNSVSMVMLEFEEGVSMDTVSVDIQQKISVLQGSWEDTVSMFTPSSNSSSTMDTLFWLVEVTSLILSSVDMDCSMGFVMVCSTDSGLAPGSEVTMMT